MSTNSTPTIYVNLAALALEANSSAVSPAIFISVPAADTLALGPVHTYEYDVGLGGLSPASEADVSYNPATSPTPRIDGVPTNLIEMADTSEIRTNQLEFDIGRILGVEGAGYLTKGQSHKFYITSSYYVLSEHESGGVFTTTSGVFVLPTSASSGTNYKFIRTSGPLDIYASGEEFWENSAGSGITGGDVCISLSASGLTHVISDGASRWYQILENNCTIERYEAPAPEPDFPSTIDNVALWLDASDEATITKNGENLVSQWNDKSGRGNHVVQSTASKKPTWTSANINGLDSIDFQSSGILENTTAGGTFSGASGEIWAVYQPDTTGVTHMLLLSSDVSSSTRYCGVEIITQDNAVVIDQNNNGDPSFWGGSGNKIDVVDVPYIIRAGSDGTVYSISINGINQTLADYGTEGNNGDWFGDTSARDIFTVGAYNLNGTEAGFSDGKMCELIVIESGNLSEADANNMYNYLFNKWFMPGQIHGIALWLDASDSDTITMDASGLVSQWSDKSGRGNHVAQSTSSKKPIWTSGSINGNGAIDFDGTDDLLVNSTAGGTFSGSSGEIWIVYQPNAVNYQYALFDSSDDASSTRFCRAFIVDDGGGFDGAIIIAQNDNGTATYQGGTTNLIDTPDVPYIVRMSSDGTAYSMSINGSGQAISAFAGVNNGDWFGDTSNRDYFALAANKYNGVEDTFGNLKMCEVIVIESGNLTSGQASGLYIYLSNKWGV